MEKPFLLLLLFFILPDPICHAQTSVKVSDPRLELKNNIIHIYYDILNSDPDEKYIISVDIKDEDGNLIKANTLNGDIGLIEDGGTNKQITWNLAADNIFINTSVFVQINAKVIAQPEPVKTEPELENVPEVISENEDEQAETPADEIKKGELSHVDGRNDPGTDKELTRSEPLSEANSKTFNRAGVVIQSLALPGLGLSRVTGNPHWLRGVAGYGCVAGSIVLNRKAISTFNEIEDLVYFDEINEAYNKSSRLDNTSEVLAYVVIGIWVTDFVWTLFGTTDLGKKSVYSKSRGFSLGSVIDPLSNIPLMRVSYRF